MPKTTNLGDKYVKRVTLRLSEQQYDFLVNISNILGCSPSDYLRMVINSGMIGSKKVIDAYNEGNVMKGMVGTSENVKTDSDDFVQ